MPAASSGWIGKFCSLSPALVLTYCVLEKRKYWRHRGTPITFFGSWVFWCKSIFSQVCCWHPSQCFSGWMDRAKMWSIAWWEHWERQAPVTCLDHGSLLQAVCGNGKRRAAGRRDATVILEQVCMSCQPTLVPLQRVDSLGQAEDGEGFMRTSFTTERWLLKPWAQRIVHCHLAAGVATCSLLGAGCLVGAENSTGFFQEFLSLQMKLCLFLPFFVKHKSQRQRVCVPLPPSSAFSSPGWKKMSSSPTFW